MEDHTHRRIYMAVAFFVALLLAFSAGVMADRAGLSGLLNASANDNSLNTGLINEAWNIIQESYADPGAVQGEQLTYGAISGMVDALGDTGHSRFLTPEMLKQQRNFTQGRFEGIGATLQMKDGNAVVVAPFDNSPAQKAGLKPGDIIIKVNGEDVEGMPLEQVVSKVLGPAGTQVKLTVMDPQTGELRDLTITRAHIDLQNVTWQMLPGTRIAHLRIAAFSQGVTKDAEKALEEIEQQGGEGIVLDLRNDPGGLLDEATGVASLFLKEGNVLQEKDAQGNIKNVPVEKGNKTTALPVVVLINNGTASAAEIVSGALQDAGRARLVGEKTFGTGTVLNEFRLSDGSALLLATEQWLTPKGRVIWHNGIAPDVEVALPDASYPLIPETERDLTAEQLRASEDSQLLRAIDLMMK